MEEKLEVVAKCVERLLCVHVLVCTVQSGSIEEFCKEFCFDPIQRVTEAQYLKNMFLHMADNTIHIVTDCLNIEYVLFRISGHCFILGPYVKEMRRDLFFETTLASNRLPVSFLIPYKLYYSKLPVLLSGQMITAAHLLVDCILGKSVDTKHQAYTIENGISLTGKDFSLDDSQQRTSELINQRYDLENLMLMEAENGNTAEAMRHWRNLSKHTSQIIYVEDPLQSQKMSVSITKTLIRKAVERGGVPPIDIDLISQDFVHRVNSAKSITEVKELKMQIVYEYCELVKKYNLKQYSPYVRKTIVYIELNLSLSLSVHMIAAQVGVSPNYLSNLFCKETGETITQFINKKRAVKSAQLLELSNMPVQDIAAYVGIDNLNYFCRIFKKIFNATPTEYRKNKL